MKTFFRILSFAKPFGRFIPSYATFSLLAVVFGLINFSLIKPLLDVLFETKEIAIVKLPSFSFSLNYFTDLFNYGFYSFSAIYGKSGALQFVCGIILFSVLMANLFRYLTQRVLARLRVYVVQNVRRDLFGKINSLHLGYFQTRKKGDVMSTMSNDVNEIENSIVNGIQVVFRDPPMLIGFIILLFTMSVKLTLFTLIVLPLSGLIISRITKSLRKNSKKGQQYLGNIMSIMDETLSGIRIIKGFNAQNYIAKKFEDENQNYSSVLKKMLNRKELASPLSELLGVSVVVGILLYGGQLVLENRSELTASEFLTYIIVYSQVLNPLKNISNAVSNIQRGIVAGDRVLEIIDTPNTIIDLPNAKEIKSFEHAIQFNSISFKYENDYVLKNINLKIPKGKMYALVGQSGAGKSTLADLVPRFYDVSEGELLVDGINVKSLKLENHINLIGIVTQNPILFNDTIRNNIAFNLENASLNEIEHAAKIANAHQFIMEMPLGYETNIGDRGEKLSGGQRQRISIARAVLKNPPILILDEATSALDTESERLVQDALFKLMENRTSLVIAHRLSTIQHADQIIVMQKGEIIEQGTHKELTLAGGMYKKLSELQTFEK